MKKRIAIALWLPLACAAASVGAARVQTADEVMDKHLAALGGRDALAKLTSRKSTGTATLAAQGGELSGPYESYNKAPNKSRVYIKFDTAALGGPGDMIIDQRFDGTSGYVSNSLQGDTEMAGNQLDNMRNGAFPSSMLKYKEMGLKAEVLAREKVDGKDAIVVQFTPKAGSTSRVYFDPDTYLVMKSVAKVISAQMGEFEQTVTPSDFRVVDGVKVPFQVVNTSPVQSLTVKLTKVEHNLPLDDAMFVRK